MAPTSPRRVFFVFRLQYYPGKTNFSFSVYSGKALRLNFRNKKCRFLPCSELARTGSPCGIPVRWLCSERRVPLSCSTLSSSPNQKESGMKISFLGAARTVTGSCHVIEAAGARFAVDCGMHQGNPAIEERNSRTELYRPAEMDFILLTHAHIDHSGLLPRLAGEGFKGTIYCTPPTLDLAELMLEDSAHIQEMEQEWKQAHNKRRGTPRTGDKALYTIEDAHKAVELMRSVEFDTPFEPHPGIKVTYRYAGHILGAAFLDLEITEQGKTTRLVFSGDLGRPGALLLHDAEHPSPPDWLFVESTYGDRDHKGEHDTLDELAQAISYSYHRKEKVIIPSFAVGRTQELLYSLILLRNRGQLPEDMPIFVDSPLAIRATEVFEKYAQTLRTPEMEGISPRDGSYNIHFTLNTQESQALNAMRGPAIILSASGMCNAGRIKHHLKHNIWREGASIVFVGYQAVGTLGRKIIDGADSVRLFNDDLAVAAKIFTINGFSAHAGQSQLLDWILPMAKAGSRVVLIHGDPRAQEALAALIKKESGKDDLEIFIPDYLEEMTLEPGRKAAVEMPGTARARPRVDWNFLIADMDVRLAQLRERQAHAEELPWEEQTELRDRLSEINRELAVFLSRIV